MVDPFWIPRRQPATTSIFGRFHPETLTSGVAPRRSADCQVTVMVCDSPGHRVMSLPFHRDVCSSLSPVSSVPLAVPRRMSVRRKNPTVGVVEVLVMVTVVSRSAPLGPAWFTVVAVAPVGGVGGFFRGWGVGYADDLGLGLLGYLSHNTHTHVVD